MTTTFPIVLLSTMVLLQGCGTGKAAATSGYKNGVVKGMVSSFPDTS